MKLTIFYFFSILTWVHFTHCQDFTADLMTKLDLLRTATLKGFEDLQQKQNDILAKLSEYEELLQEIPELHRDLELVKDFHHELEHVKGAVNSNQDSLQRIHLETKGCLGREDLEHFKNISSAGQQELESSLRQGISGVISLLETGGIDECSEGSHNCTDYETCNDKLFNYRCSCLPGFARDGSRCEDVDECAQGKDECSPLATCRNNVGSYGCSCNPPFEGDGRTCSCPPGFAQRGSNCEDVHKCRTQVRAECEYPAEVLKGLGCVKLVTEWETFEEMNATCHEAGGRLLQDLTQGGIQELHRAFVYIEWNWIGVQEGKWLDSGLPLQKEFRAEGSWGSNPSRRGLCGLIFWDRSSSLFKVGEADCSDKRWGYCQFVSPQK
ncbi:protein kinase C-binding protein NELL1-like isoform X2 [Macrobrachium nipponense]|uniref:protein kinase C-binding protein NELL1-like isoform X2 n=1 Tax=Macrobrachium nipponense TaxID=159736 RepID=UPI0030C8C6D9